VNERDMAMLKNLRGTIYYSYEYMREEMSEYVIFDKGKPDQQIFDDTFNDLGRLGRQVSILIKKYEKRTK
jgi:hypothetical protein